MKTLSQASRVGKEARRQLLERKLRKLADGPRVAPLSFAQQRLWFLDQLEPNRPLYNLPVLVQFKGKLDVPALEKSLNAIISRHEVLRTRFVSQNDEPRQIVTQPEPIPLEIKEVSDSGGEGVRPAWEKLIRAEAARPFNLSEDRLLRAVLFRLEPEIHLLLLTMHHIVSDEWSVRILFRELATIYAAMIESRQARLPALPIQYADYALWQRKWLKGPVLEEHLNFWKEHLAGNPPILELATDHPRRPSPGLAGATVHRRFPMALGQAVKQMGNRHEATLYMVLLAAFKALLYRYTGQQDLVLGTPMAGRSRPETEELVGFFVNTLPLRSRVRGDMTFEALLAQTRKLTLNAYSHQELPLEKLVESLRPERSGSQMPFTNIVFMTQNTLPHDITFPGLSWEFVDVDTGTAKFDLTVAVEEAASGLTARAEYNTALFEKATVERLLKHFEVLLDGIVARPNARLAGLPLLGPVEKHQLLVAWNDTRKYYPQRMCLHQIFEEQVARTPKSIAFKQSGGREASNPSGTAGFKGQPSRRLGSLLARFFEGARETRADCRVRREEPSAASGQRGTPYAVPYSGKLTYAGLNSQANQLAHYLRREHGIGPGVPVGVCLQSSAEMLVAMLAILKAGGAYVPLDPRNPAERLEFMLGDTGTPVLLTQSKLVRINTKHLLPNTKLQSPGRAGHSNTRETPNSKLQTPETVNTRGGEAPDRGPYVFCLDTDWGRVAGESRENLPNMTSPESLAYVMYTSGSTGQPKGVAIPHRAVARLVLNTNFVQIRPEDRIAQVSNISFDAATLEIWGSLLNGSQLVGIPRETVLRPPEFAEALRSEEITVMFLTTALFNQMAMEAPGAFENMETLIVGGEALEPKWVRAVLRDRPPKRLVNGYGPTENTTFTCCCLIKECAEGATTVPIGRPITNTTVYILDEHLNPVPVGVPGELYAGGDGLARGYWNRPDLTEARFVENPFGQSRHREGASSRGLPASANMPARENNGIETRGQDGRAPRGRLYRTGDLAKYLPDGRIEFLGRADQQVKVRGFRIEPGEIETVLSQHPAVRECVVTVHGQKAESKKLVAYVVLNQSRAGVSPVQDRDPVLEEGRRDACPTLRELREYLAGRLPEYMVPSLFVPLEALPLNSNGKIDRKALPEPDPTRPELNRKYSAPRDEIERKLIEIWENILEVKPIGIEDNFFYLGGHSLLAIKLIGKIEKAFERKLRLSAIFQAPTIGRLSAFLRDEKLEAIAAQSLVQIQPRGEKPPLFLVHGAGGGMFWGYSNLVKHLGAGQPVFGFQSRGLDDGVEHESIAKMAAQYIAELRIVQPHGPYYLGGYCFGGNVAYEMACQLQAQGQSVALVALMNCAPPNSDYTRVHLSPSWLLRFVWNLGSFTRSFLHWSEVEQWNFFRWKWTVLKRRLSLRRMVARAGAGAETGPGLVSGNAKMSVDDLVDLSSFSPEQRSLWEAHIRALLGFYPQQYSGQVHLFRSPGHPLFCSYAEDYGWGSYCTKGAEITILPAGHERILEEPCVKLLAEELNEALDQASGRSQRSASTCQIGPTGLAGLAKGAAKEETLSQLFQAQAFRTPNAEALVCGNTRLTYHELYARSTLIAERLRALGVGDQTLVGICLERSWEMVSGILGALLAGGAYVPMDPAYPADRLAFMLEDSGASVVLTQRKLRSRLEGFRVQGSGREVKVICVEDALEGVRPAAATRTTQHAVQNPKSEIRNPKSSDLAYIIYTSGSTGRPKGVALEHRSAVALMDWVKEAFTAQELAGVLASTSICFDLSVFELFAPLSWGGRVILAENALALGNLPAAREVTLINTVPSAMRELLRLKAVPETVKVIALAGEPLSGALVDQIYAQTQVEKVYDLYGPTETTTYSTWALRRAGEKPTIGRPLPGEQVYLLDEHMKPVPAGAAGEICIGGVGLARGYLNRPELTAEKFVQNPFKQSRDREGASSGGIPGSAGISVRENSGGETRAQDARAPRQRLYRTGDLGRWREDGQLEYVGRLDNQVKLRGYRIELGEIEAVLREHPAVGEAVVVARGFQITSDRSDRSDRSDESADKRLVAYLVARAGAELSESELRQWVIKKLPAYMEPAYFVELESFPLTPNGKIDRKALPAPPERSAGGREIVPPRSPAEEKLAAIWREVLGIAQVGINESFFALGGHSLLAVQIISRVREAFGAELPLSSLFDAPTIEALAQSLSSGRWNSLGSALSLERAPRDRPLPASFVQKRLWILHQLAPNSPAYHVPVALRLKGSLQIQSLEDALNDVVRRHEALRTTFRYEEPDLIQVVADEVFVEIAVPRNFVNPVSPVGLVRQNGYDQAAIGDWISREVGRPFDLSQGPLLRANMLRLSEHDHILLVVFHHTVCDGWSLATFFEELGQFYKTHTSKGGVVPKIADLQFQYPDFAVWERNRLQGEVLAEAMGYWKEQLSGAPPAIDLPADRPSQTQPSNRAAQHSQVLGPELAAGVLEISRRENLTPFIVLLTALDITLQKWTGQQDLVVGTVVAGRTRREFESVIGCFMNFLPIRAKIAGTETGAEMLARVRAAVLKAQAHQDCPFDKIVEAVNPPRHPNRNPIYNVGLLLQNFPNEIFRAENLQVSRIKVPVQDALLDLRFEAEGVEGDFSICCEYKSDLFEARTIEQLLACLGQVLETLVRRPQTPLSDFPVVLTSNCTTKQATAVSVKRESFSAQESSAGFQPAVSPISNRQTALNFPAADLSLPAQAGSTATQQVGNLRYEVVPGTEPVSAKSQQTIAVAATFTAEPVADALRYWLQKLQLPAQIEFAPFNQVFQQLLDPCSLLSSNKSGLNLIFVRIQDWSEPETDANEFLRALKAAAIRSSAPYVVCFCPGKPNSEGARPAPELEKVESALASELAEVGGVSVITTKDVERWYSVHEYYDPEGDELAHLPYTPVFFTALATAVARRFHSLQRSAYKVIALDCDQTLWSGVCGEDGPKGVRMDEARQALQEFMREQHAAGMLLCLCSKNNEADVFEVFGHRLDMPLRREHLAACKINWRPKSENLKALAQELGLGLDSFIFLDDDPLECAELEANCPEVLTLQLPEKLEQIPQFLNHCWAFDHIRTTSEDRRRSDLYRENQAREAMRLETPTLAGFLASLELRIQIEPMSSAQVPRVAQLTQRTNQFNCTTRRLAESDVERFLPSKTAVLNSGEAFTVQVSDRFGDYGLVGVILFETQGDALDVSTFLLSCRALGRGVEYQMLARMGSLALERKLRWVDVHFVPSSRNQPALDFLRTVGAAYQQPRNGGSVFRFPAEVAAETRFQPDKAGTQPTGSAGVSSASNSAVPKNRPDLASPIADSAQQTQRTPFREIALLSLDPARIHHGVESAFNRQSPREARHEPPRTKTQALLCDLWSQVLHLETVGVNDNFFELGGNSLAAVQLASRIRRAFKVEMLLEGLFDAQTISALASNLDAGKWPRSERDLAHPTPVPRTGPMPLSFAQERLWFLDQLEPRSALYNVPIATRISGSLDLSVLQRSLQAIIDRHESLRTRFVWNGDGPAQIVDSAVALDVRPLDLVTSKGEPQHLHQLPGSEREGQWSVVSGQWSPAVQRVVHDEVNRPFDLTAGPLVRALLLRIGPSEHLLVLTLHHIVADEWSLKLLFEELASFYASFARGEQPTLDPLSIQYADYAVWQRQSLQGERLEQLLNFWKQQLAGSPPVTHCPTDHPRAVSPTFRGRVEELTLSPRLSAELKQLGNAQDATLYMVLLAAFKALLFRYSRQTDLIISSPVAGRASRETEDLIGFFVNTVLLRTDLSGNPEFRQLLRRVRTVALAVFAHQDLPFEKLVEALQPERSTDHNPFTKIMFGVESSGLERMQLPGADVQFHEVATDTAKFDITLIAQDRSSGLNLRAEYNTDLFEPATITRLLQHFEVLLRGIVAWPDKRISELPLLPAAERQRVLVDWNSVRADFPTDECLNQLFEAQAERSPRATAVVCGEESINYRDLDERAARLAQHLVQCGIGPDVPVGICLERSIQMVVGLLGVLKAGGAYVPMDPAYPADRLAFILEDSGAPVLLTQRKLKTKAEELRVQGSGRKLNAICLEEVFEDSQSADATRNTQHASRNPKSEIRTPKSSNLAYIIYTSGSTGRPKGVLLEHRSAVALMHWAKEAFTAEELSGVLASTSICFDLSVFELFAPLSWGGRVILAENALALSSLPAARDVSLINTVPSAMRELLRLKAVPETVKVIALAGEPLSEALVDQIYAQTKVEKVYDLYGPTETTVYSTWALRRAGEQPTIGRPLPGEQVYVLDEQMQPMPLGVAGEIYIGGVGQARGYLNRPDLTSERFVNSPFQQSRDREGAPGGSLPGSASPARENDGGETRGQDARAPRARLYRTGDLGRWRPDGQLEYLGRLDNQVKVRGFRIELGEIEVVLRQHPAVGEAVVVARNFGVGSDRSDRSDEALEKRLVAYVIPRTEEELSENELRRWVAKKLPPYMEPAHFVQLEKLPLTPNGKVDRKALPAPQEKQTLGSSSPQRPPGNETEKLLAGVWCRILGRESVGINENFFHVGGHSLLAVRLLAEVEKTAGKKLPLVSLFQGPTIEQMAKALSAEGDRPSGSLVVPIRSGGKRAPLFLVHGAGGEVFWGYANLAAHLNSEQPIYGIKSRGQAGLPEFTTIEQMAACYIQEIRRVQPSGPYHLGGYCLGGNIAYEMARQLRAAGQPVGAVLLLDSAPANAGYDILAWWKPLFGLRFAANFWLWLKDFEQLSRQDRLRLIARKSKAFWRKLRGKVGPASRLPSPWHSAPVENRAAPLDLEEVVDPTYFTEQELNLWRVHLQARATHTDKAYHGQVILLRTKGQPLFCSLDPDFCWSKVAKGGVIVKRIPGSHENIFLEPNVRFLAREIEACLSGCNGEANEVLTTDKHG